jgi:hypothetical protein
VGHKALPAMPGPPHGRTRHPEVLLYSQAADPTSPFSFDQTKLYSRKAWIAP